ncbi:hypothetical protein HYDPIDRAFT_105424 [Hydnomerulius pinastri MD-312]|nr:hypothetical protein HYDPIDRAFT_105424 [Hydnomerulius pinastri MD-312]
MVSLVNRKLVRYTDAFFRARRHDEPVELTQEYPEPAKPEIIPAGTAPDNPSPQDALKSACGDAPDQINVLKLTHLLTVSTKHVLILLRRSANSCEREKVRGLPINPCGDPASPSVKSSGDKPTNSRGQSVIIPVVKVDRAFPSPRATHKEPPRSKD